MKVQHQNEITETLCKIEKLGISAEFSDLTNDCHEIDWKVLPSNLNPSKGDTICLSILHMSE